MNEANEAVPRAQKEIKLTPAEETRFWDKVDKSADLNGCWLWTGGKFKGGYGAFKVGGKMLKAHRIAWTLSNGQIPHDGSSHGICVCHRCDNPPCCNSEHLFLGTNTENSADREAKGRNNPPRGDKNGSRLHPERLARGEEHGSAKLTSTEVVAIRLMYASGGITHRQLGSQFGVTNCVIGDIIHRRTWKHV